MAAPESESEPTQLTWEDVPRLMDDLRDLARRLLARWPGMESLQPTLLVDTALRRQRRSDQTWDEVTWESRDQFFGQIFRAMRQKLGQYRQHQKTTGYRAQRRISTNELELYNTWREWTEDPDLAMALAVGLERLNATDPTLAKVVEYRFFSGLTWEDVAGMLESSPATVKRQWQKGRILMEHAIREQLDEQESSAREAR